MQAYFGSLSSVVKLGATVVLVVGESTLLGQKVSTANACLSASFSHGFELVGKWERDIPVSKRYLPLAGGVNEQLQRRMRTEFVLELRKTKP